MKLHMPLIFDPGTLLPGIYPDGNSTKNINVLLVIGKSWKLSKCPNKTLIEETVIHTTGRP